MRAGSLAWSTIVFGALSIVAWPNEANAAPRGSQPAFDADSINYQPPKTARRGGFAMGLTSGFGGGVYRGYELSVDALNDPSQRQSTGLTLATFTTLWLGGSPRDWLTLGLGVISVSAQSDEVFGAGGAMIAHIEGYPFFSRGGEFQNLGLGFSGGIGIINLVDAEERDFQAPLAESGSLSTLSFDAFWEPWRLWHFSFGPAVNYTHGFSQTLTMNQFTIGFRAALYGVQPKKKRPSENESAYRTLSTSF